MKSGRRVADPNAKKLAGTYRGDRHATITATAEPVRDLPVRPGYMTAEGKAVWEEELQRVVACGLTSADSTFYARYCELEAIFRVAVMAREVPTSSLVTELRRAAELLGIAGHRSRLIKAATAQPEKAASPFAPRAK